MLIFSFKLICFYDSNLLINLYEKYNVYDNLEVNITKDDVKMLTDKMMNYLNNKEDELSYSIIVNENKMDFFSERTKIHFSDVKVLMNNLINLAYITFIILIILIIFLKGKINFRQYMISLMLTFIIYIFFIICIAINFDSFFITFHKIFFSNDYWILDPNYDYVISLLPEELFKNITIRILILFTLLMFIVSFCLKILFRPEAK